MNEQAPGQEPRAAVSLRPYQEAAITAAGEMIQEKRAKGEPGRALIVLPTGCGKTHTAITLLERALERKPDARVMWIAHRKELLDQPISAMARVETTRWMARRAGVVQGSRSRPERQIVMASIQTLVSSKCRRLHEVLSHGVPSIVVIDEAHHSTSPQYRAAINEIAEQAEQAGVAVSWIGLTATPERTDGAGLSSFWGPDPAFNYGITDAIRDGYLCRPRFVDAQLQLPPEVQAELDRLEARGDDEAMGDLLLRAGVVPATVKAMDEHLGKSPQTGRPVPSIVFCANKRQAAATTEALLAGGWRADLLTGETGAVSRAGILDAFTNDMLDVIVNVAVLTEGTDLPRCGGIVAGRPFSSKPLWMQSIGRGLRLFPEKDECIVVDLAGAHKEHNGVIGVALIGDGGIDEDADGKKLPGITYTITCAELQIDGKTYRSTVLGPDGEPVPLFVRGLPVIRGQARGSLPPGLDRGAPVEPIAVGVTKEKDGKKYVAWERIRPTEAGEAVAETRAAALPVSGHELSRKAAPGSKSDLTRERRPVEVAWTMAKIAGHDVRVVGLAKIGEESRYGALWVVESGHADGEPGFVLGVRYQGRTARFWKPEEKLRLITGYPVPWSTISALASDYVRQAARTSAADEPWRAEPPAEREVAKAIRAGVPHMYAHAVASAGALHDLIVRRQTEIDPCGPECLARMLAVDSTEIAEGSK